MTFSTSFKYWQRQNKNPLAGSRVIHTWPSQGRSGVKGLALNQTEIHTRILFLSVATEGYAVRAAQGRPRSGRRISFRVSEFQGRELEPRPLATSGCEPFTVPENSSDFGHFPLHFPRPEFLFPAVSQMVLINLTLLHMTIRHAEGVRVGPDVGS